MNIARAFLIGLVCIFPGQVFAMNYQCQIVSTPGLFYRTINWDGSTPFQYPIEFKGMNGVLNIRSIGLAGHPDYLFDLTFGSRTLMSVSQERNAKDYNLTWRSDADNASDAMIQIACRSNGTVATDL